MVAQNLKSTRRSISRSASRWTVPGRTAPGWTPFSTSTSARYLVDNTVAIAIFAVRRTAFEEDPQILALGHMGRIHLFDRRLGVCGVCGDERIENSVVVGVERDLGEHLSF